METSSAKPAEIELWSNRRLIHPLSRRLAAGFARTPLTPNMVSCLGVVASLVAAGFYALPVWPVSVLGGFLGQVGWHVLDGADGELARRTGRCSPSGEVVDGICDYLSQIAVYSVLALLLSRSLGGWAWALAAASGLARAVQANSYESRRRIYQYWGYGGRWLRETVTRDEASPRGWLSVLARIYLSISDRVAKAHPGVEAELRARLSRSPEEAERTRALYRRAQIGALRAAQPLSANARTIAIGLSMLAGSPLYFFVYETVGLTLVLIWSLRIQARADADLARDLQLDADRGQAVEGFGAEADGELPLAAVRGRA